MTGHRLKNDNCIHLRCLDCGEIFHGDTTRNFLNMASRHIFSQHRDRLGDGETWTREELMDAVMDKIYVQKCFSWEAVE